MITKPLDGDRARRAGRQLADEMAEAWLWRWPYLTPGEMSAVAISIRERLGILPRQARSKRARNAVSAAIETFGLRMNARKRSHLVHEGIAAEACN